MEPDRGHDVRTVHQRLERFMYSLHHMVAAERPFEDCLIYFVVRPMTILLYIYVLPLDS